MFNAPVEWALYMRRAYEILSSTHVMTVLSIAINDCYLKDSTIVRVASKTKPKSDYTSMLTLLNGTSNPRSWSRIDLKIPPRVCFTS